MRIWSVLVGWLSAGRSELGLCCLIGVNGGNEMLSDNLGCHLRGWLLRGWVIGLAHRHQSFRAMYWILIMVYLK